jgi:hypothetical protein
MACPQQSRVRIQINLIDNTPFGFLSSRLLMRAIFVKTKRQRDGVTTRLREKSFCLTVSLYSARLKRKLFLCAVSVFSASLRLIKKYFHRRDTESARAYAEFFSIGKVSNKVANGISFRAVSPSRRPAVFFLALLLLTTLTGCSSCRQKFFGKKEVTAKTLSDVPAHRLSYRLEVDVQTPQGLTPLAKDDKVKSVENDFTTNRQVDALHATILSPDGQKVIAIYSSPESSEGEYQIDLYNQTGALIRNITNPQMAVVAPETISWSPDGNLFAFIAKRSKTAPQTPNDEPTQGTAPPPIVEGSPVPTATPTPSGPFVPAFPNEQIYTCRNDGLDLKPLTVLKTNLVYFYFAWSPDATQLVALACRRDEFDSRPPELAAAGRPRLINLQGIERLLDDKLTDVLPVWSPDASKVATAFVTDVKIYDAGTDSPSQAIAPLREPLIAASRAYDEKEKSKSSNGNTSNPSPKPAPTEEEPASFYPIVRLFWSEDKVLYLQTGYVRNFEDGPVNNFMRWHLLNLSPQSTVLQ